MKKEETFYYFFMKVGFSNSFLKHAEALGGLWVGFGGTPLPRFESEGLCIKSAKEKADLRYLAVASSALWRDEVRIVTYSKDALLIWKPTADFRSLSPSDGGIDWADKNLYKNFDKTWHKHTKDELGGVGSEKFFKEYFGPTGWKLLPASLENVVSRELLIAPIDSLSVWQSFSRNTFQPMFSLEGNESTGKLSWLTSQSGLDPMQISSSESLQERPFGKFIRLYLDKFALKNEESSFMDLSDVEKEHSVLAILNPAQVETAAMLMCKDLGLTVDVGIGKGLDTVDVKATVRHLPSKLRSEKIAHAISMLETAGVKFSDRLRHTIVSTKTLRIQCKARPGKAIDGNVLLLEPTALEKEVGLDRISLARISRMKEFFPEVEEWMQLLKFDLAG